MNSIDRDREVFDPTDVTARVDFKRSYDKSRLQHLNALVTGGATGLGAAITRGLCRQGHVTIRTAPVGVCIDV